MTRLGIEVYTTESHLLSLAGPQKKMTATASRLTFEGAADKPIVEPADLMELRHFEAVHMRKEPPYDMSYLETLWLLDQARGHNQLKIINDPIALQQVNEKLVIADFEDYAAPLLVSSHVESLYEFAVQKCDCDIVVKPLNLYGGRGVVRLSNPKTLFDDLVRETEKGSSRRLVQRYEPLISKGEVRVFTVAGQDVHWCLKVPDSNNFLANTRAGSSLHKYIPEPSEVAAVRDMAKNLLQRGIVVAGFDMIQGRVSEINITCPALLDPDRKSLVGIDQAVELLIEWIGT